MQGWCLSAYTPLQWLYPEYLMSRRLHPVYGRPTRFLCYLFASVSCTLLSSSCRRAMSALSWLCRLFNARSCSMYDLSPAIFLLAGSFDAWYCCRRFCGTFCFITFVCVRTSGGGWEDFPPQPTRNTILKISTNLFILPP